MSLETEIKDVLARVRRASKTLALCSTDQKNAALKDLARELRSSAGAILLANRQDLERARATGVTGAFLDRLALDEARIEVMARGVEQVAALPDPVGETIAKWTRPNGLAILQVRVPIGVIAVIYESRPNVTIDAGALCLKAGSAAVLRGGREAIATNGALTALIGTALEHAGIPLQAVWFVDNPDHEAVQILKRQVGGIDLIIPRGGNTLKAALRDSAVPLLPHFDGICHTYVDRRADLKMAEEISINAKCARPSVCNSMETLLVHREIAQEFLPRVAQGLTKAGVEIRGCERTREFLPSAAPATDADWDREYLDLILAIKVVDSLDEAIEFITKHGSGLADAIVTDDPIAASRFETGVDSASVFVNASTRFADGFEFGFGAETGISTNRLHARGPMGLRELTTYKYLVRGRGQVRL
ncbi:MAG TPA: glutamate-5-semialdehyde dehydrogenase [Candidatus Binataceae bacterium]